MLELLTLGLEYLRLLLLRVIAIDVKVSFLNLLLELGKLLVRVSPVPDLLANFCFLGLGFDAKVFH